MLEIVHLPSSQRHPDKGLKYSINNTYQKFYFFPGKNFTDHMLVCDWDSINGWHTPKISPFAVGF